MKMYGYTINGAGPENTGPSQLTEATIVANSNELRMIADFIRQTADSMEKMGQAYEHEHLSDVNLCFEDSPHFIVARSAS